MLRTHAGNGRTYQIPDLTGRRFGRLVVVSYVGKRGRLHYWMCRCDCDTEKAIEGWSLRKNVTKSCGCLQREAVSRRGKKHPHFRGGKSRDANGYVTLTSKEHGENTGRREHRVVMEARIGRPLHRHEIVHHKNGDKSNNGIENLEIMTRAGHARHHHS